MRSTKEDIAPSWTQSSLELSTFQGKFFKRQAWKGTWTWTWNEKAILNPLWTRTPKTQNQHIFAFWEANGRLGMIQNSTDSEERTLSGIGYMLCLPWRVTCLVWLEERPQNNCFPRTQVLAGLAHLMFSSCSTVVDGFKVALTRVLELFS